MGWRRRRDDEAEATEAPAEDSADEVLPCSRCGQPLIFLGDRDFASTGASDFYAQADRIHASTESAEPLSAPDATRALAATEIASASDILAQVSNGQRLRA